MLGTIVSGKLAKEGTVAQFDEAILDRRTFAIAIERALAHGEERALVLVDPRSAPDAGPQAEDWGALMLAFEARMARTIRPGDLLARLDGDRLAILTEPQTARGAAERVAARLADRLGEPFHVGGREVELRPRIGVGYPDGEADTAAAMLRRAEAVAR